MKTLFNLGRVNITASVSAAMSYSTVISALEQFASGNWGDICLDDWNRNGYAISNGGRIIGVYHDEKGKRFWVITEADRSLTTVLLPEDFRPFRSCKQKLGGTKHSL